MFEGILTLSQAKHIWESIQQNRKNLSKNEIEGKYLIVLMRLIDNCKAKEKVTFGERFDDILLHLFEVSISLNNEDFIEKSNEFIESFIKKILQRHSLTRDTYHILKMLKNSNGIFFIKYETLLAPVKKKLLIDSPTYPSDFSLFIDYMKDLDIPFTLEEFQILKEKAEIVLDGGISCTEPSKVDRLDEIKIYCDTHYENNTYYSDHIGDIDTWCEIREDVEKMESYFGINAYYDQNIEDLYEQYLQSHDPDNDNEVDRIREEKSFETSNKDIDSLFESLLEKS